MYVASKNAAAGDSRIQKLPNCAGDSREMLKIFWNLIWKSS